MKRWAIIGYDGGVHYGNLQFVVEWLIENRRHGGSHWYRSRTIPGVHGYQQEGTWYPKVARSRGWEVVNPYASALLGFEVHDDILFTAPNGERLSQEQWERIEEVLAQAGLELHRLDRPSHLRLLG